MEYNDHKPIYLQIADRMLQNILSGEWREEGRIPSVREMGGIMGVNPNTVVRSYQQLEALDIIYNKRGMGYYVQSEAVAKIKKNLKEEFVRNDIPKLRETLKALEIDVDELCRLLEGN